MTSPSPAARVGGEATRAAVPTCSWAACHKPATAVADSWPMCRSHLAEHHTLAAEEGRPAAQEELDDAVRRLNGRGWTDRQMADATGVSWHQVRYRRRVMGLLANQTAAACGTRSGYNGHRDRGEPACPPCQQVRRAYDAARYARRRAA